MMELAWTEVRQCGTQVYYAGWRYSLSPGSSFAEVGSWDSIVMRLRGGARWYTEEQRRGKIGQQRTK